MLCPHPIDGVKRRFPGRDSERENPEPRSVLVVEPAATGFDDDHSIGGLAIGDRCGGPAEDSYRPNHASGNIISFNIYETEKAAGRNHFQTGQLQTYTLSMRGGTDRLRYFLSADYGDDAGIVSYNWKKQTNLRSNLTILPSDQVTVNVSLGYITGQTSFMQQRTAWGMWEQFQWANPEGQDRILRGFLRARPEEIADNRAIRDLNRFTGSATLTHVPRPWFTHRVIIGTDVLNEENSQLFPRRAVPEEFGALALGNIEIDRPRREYQTLDYAASATYGGLPGLGENVQFTSSFGLQYYARTEEIVSGIGQVFPAPQITTLSGAASTSAGQSFVENKSVGLYVQQEMGWNDRLFLTAAVRGDDNSAFGADFDAAIYPKFSGTWVLSEEDFWGGLDDYVSSFRLRSAWGKAGRQPDTFAGVTLYAPEPGPGGQTVRHTRRAGQPGSGAGSQLGDRGWLRCRVPRRADQRGVHLLQSAGEGRTHRYPGPTNVRLPRSSDREPRAAHQLGLGAEHERPDP